MNKFILCTSWDDGDHYNLKMAALLDKYDLKGTFFIPTKSIDKGRLIRQDLKDLAARHEIGSHTATHPDLSAIDVPSASEEIGVSKMILENLIGREVASFCYPYGRYSQGIVGLVRKFGYKCARTTGRYNVSDVSNAYLVAPTVHFSHRFISPLTLELFVKNPRFFLANHSIAEAAVFRRAFAGGLFFHLWGHSWDVEMKHHWKRLEEMLVYLRTNFDFESLTFGEMVGRISVPSKVQNQNLREHPGFSH